MLEIKNTEVFGLNRAIKASGNAKTIGEIDTRCDLNKMSVENGKHIDRAERLGKAPVGSAHDHFLLGIHVQFDIKYPQYWTIEAERYHNFEIITSQSKMHRLTTMGKDEKFEDMFNKYVDDRIIDIVRTNIDAYNRVVDMEDNGLPITIYNIDGVHHERFENKSDALYKTFMRCVSNLPMGFELWMTCDLTYLQLKTMYFQRVNHKLKEDWSAFCDWCESLPMFKELVLK